MRYELPMFRDYVEYPCFVMCKCRLIGLQAEAVQGGTHCLSLASLPASMINFFESALRGVTVTANSLEGLFPSVSIAGIQSLSLSESPSASIVAHTPDDLQ